MHAQCRRRWFELAGRIALKFVLSTEGSVTQSIVSSSTLGNLRVETCIAEAARRWEFPAVKDGGLAIVTYPFNLKPRPAGKTTPIPVTAGRRDRGRRRTRRPHLAWTRSSPLFRTGRRWVTFCASEVAKSVITRLTAR
jgi:hypothetical protein